MPVHAVVDQDCRSEKIPPNKGGDINCRALGSSIDQDAARH